MTPAISLWPNPATNESSLDLSQLPAGSYQVSVMDATGRTILSMSLYAGSSHRLDLRDAASGAYIVTVRGSGANATLALQQRLLKN